MEGYDIKRENLLQLADYREHLREHPRLTYLFIEMTNHCNMECLHCGSECSPEKKKNVDVEEVAGVLEEVRDRYGSGSVMICLTGGEPMLHPRFRQMVETINRLQFPWGMTTNGSLISGEMAQFLRKNHMGSISISLDGLQETHDAFRRSPGSYRKALCAVENLHSCGIPVQITTVVNSRNIEEMDGLYEILKTYQVESWRPINMEPIGRALLHPELLLDRDNYRYLLEYIRQKRFDNRTEMEVTYGCSHYLPMEYERTVRDTYFICGAGISVASILCNGDIFTCLDIKRDDRLIQGNIATNDFCDVWENQFDAFRTDRTSGSEMCENCGERYLCAGDSAHTWDFETGQPMLCLYRQLAFDENYGKGDAMLLDNGECVEKIPTEVVGV